MKAAKCTKLTVRCNIWLVALSFLKKKTKIIQFCNKRKLHPHPTLYVVSQLISVIPEIKFLGQQVILQTTNRLSSNKALNVLKIVARTQWEAVQKSHSVYISGPNWTTSPLYMVLHKDPISLNSILLQIKLSAFVLEHLQLLLLPVYEYSSLHHSEFLIRIIHPPLSDLHLNMPV